ncbi:hypothetical protein DEJ39_02065 [Bacteroidetes bacterium SCGC AAA795-G10]|nr:hypothetical protein DEJ39_02065 [Bacteroidetes bacterium SCGC AAA795-G10]
MIIKKDLSEILSLLSNLNISNHSIIWWAFNFTSKNPLSSGFFDSYFYKKKSTFLSPHLTLIKNTIWFFVNLIKSIYLLIQTYFFFISLENEKSKINVHLFSFVDGRKRGNMDTYFRDLITKIIKSNPELKVSYLFYVYRPYFRNNNALKFEKNKKINLLSYLTIKDFFWCFFQLFRIPFLTINFSNVRLKNSKKELNYIIRSQMISEMTTGFIDNLIIFRAFRRISKLGQIEKIIYPFENKSLEKLMLLALGNIKTIGYQHSSVSHRHFSLILSKDEIKINPLPEKIVTIGEITKNWLIDVGNFPEEIIKTGVYLRGNRTLKLRKRFFDKKNPKLLFVFSSGYDEVKKTINFLDTGNKVLDSYKIKFRFHPDFPIYGLNKYYNNWITNNVDSISKKSLNDELKWCDILVYISSSVVIEAISAKIPVINLNIDIYNSDPLLNKKLSLKKVVTNNNDFTKAINYFSEISNKDNIRLYSESINYIDKYAINKTKLDVKTFL